MFRKPTSGLNRPCPLTSSTLSLTHTSQVPWYSDGVRPLNHRKPTRSRGLRTAKSSDPTKFSPANAKSRINCSHRGGLPSNYVPHVKLEVKYRFLLGEGGGLPGWYG